MSLSASVGKGEQGAPDAREVWCATRPVRDSIDVLGAKIRAGAETVEDVRSGPNERVVDGEGEVMREERAQDLSQLALRAFERDLPQLWTERPGQWVAYRGDRQLGFAHHKHELYQDCFRQGWK